MNKTFKVTIFIEAEENTSMSYAKGIIEDGMNDMACTDKVISIGASKMVESDEHFSPKWQSYDSRIKHGNLVGDK